jgi:hypothetical protein
MKHIVLLALLGLSFSPVQGQYYPTISEYGDAIWLSESIRFDVGTDIRLGTGSTDDGSFKYIRISSQSWLHKDYKCGINSRITNQANSLPISFTGLRMHIKKLRFVGNEKRGQVIYLVLGGGTATNYECDIVQAVRAGEVECDGCEVFRKINSNVVMVNQLSIADELTKLKKLKDDGMLSKTEYQTQKEKLLNK